MRLWTPLGETQACTQAHKHTHAGESEPLDTAWGRQSSPEIHKHHRHTHTHSHTPKGRNGSLGILVNRGGLTLKYTHINSQKPQALSF